MYGRYVVLAMEIVGMLGIIGMALIVYLPQGMHIEMLLCFVIALQLWRD